MYFHFLCHDFLRIVFDLKKQQLLPKAEINTRLPQLPQDVAAPLPNPANFPSESWITIDTVKHLKERESMKLHNNPEMNCS